MHKLLLNDSVMPKISIITPSYNQGKYIEQTIKSVINLSDKNVEYIIIDGGSNDETVGIIKKYEKSLSYWVSENDEGQSHAINKGLNIATGDIIGWLNSDDIYMTDIMPYVLANLDVSKPEICFGNCIHFEQIRQAVKTWGSDVVYQDSNSLLENHDYIIQPSSFWTRKALDLVGPLRQDLHYAFDWEWFLRAKKAGVTFRSIPNCISMYRIHDEHKSGTGGHKRRDEILSIYSQYSPRYSELYSLLMHEDLSCNILYKKLVRKFLYLLGRPHSDIDTLLFLKRNKYKKYSLYEIKNCISML